MTVAAMAERRSRRREPLYQSRRRYPRVFLDVDWFVESAGCSSLGRGLEISLRSAFLPIETTAPFPPEVTLYVCLPGRARMFRASGTASQRNGKKGWLVRFASVTQEDLGFLGQALLEACGLSAFPALDRKFSRFASLPKRFLTRPSR